MSNEWDQQNFQQFYDDDEKEIDQDSEKNLEDTDDDVDNNYVEICDQLIDILTDERNFGSDEEGDDQDQGWEKINCNWLLGTNPWLQLLKINN